MSNFWKNFLGNPVRLLLFLVLILVNSSFVGLVVSVVLLIAASRTVLMSELVSDIHWNSKFTQATATWITAFAATLKVAFVADAGLLATVIIFIAFTATAVVYLMKF